MDDTGRYARFATHLNAKKAGPLVCPICKATETFEAKGTLSGPPSNPLTSTDLPTSANPQFNYATCTNCGYSIFFDTGVSDLPE
jgi:predicted nucleic-acid-binding Zn-ribbon protein